jgi:hypothetical protein
MNMTMNQNALAPASSRSPLRAVAAVALPALLLLLGACAGPPVVKAPPAGLDVSDCSACHAGKGAYKDAANVYRFWDTSGHGKFLNRPQQRPTCDACHDLKGPGAAGHLDGKKNAPGPNTFHLVEGFIAQAPKNEWDFQVQFDNYCWLTCHQPAGIPDMRHERDAGPTKWAVQMGTHASYEKPLADYPVDGDLAVFPGSATPPFFVTCVTCHDPHGSDATSMTGKSNRMTRENYKEPPKMCSRCHI